MRRLIFICIFIILSQLLEINNASPGKGGRGGSSGGSRGGGFRSGVKSIGSGLKGLKGGGGLKSIGSGLKKANKGGRLTKLALIGGGAYGAYQIGKIAGKFGSWRGHGSWGYKDWDSWREVDGLLCRKNDDCKWIDPRLYCQDYELDFSPTRAWFGGDFAAIVGECACPDDMIWNNYEVKCEQQNLGQFIGIGLASIVGIVVGILACCCCCACCFLSRKFFGK